MSDRKALILANDDYADPELNSLLSPASDAEALARVLGDPAIGGFEVQVARNEPAHVMAGRIEDFFAEGRTDDLLLLHFSGHGLKDDAGELYLAAANTRPSRLGSSAIAASFVRRTMRDCRSAGIVLLLDCCYGAAFNAGTAVRAAGDVHVLDAFPAERIRGKGRAVITASSSMEYAFEGERLADRTAARPSVFTGALTRGLLTGEADRDADGWVALDELYDYILDQVKAANPRQTPGRSFDLQGNIYLARSGRRRIPVPPIPEDLREAMANPDAYARMGAVGELRLRLLGGNPAVAAGAREALERIAASDVSHVARAAREALHEAARPERPVPVVSRVPVPNPAVAPRPAPEARRPAEGAARPAGAADHARKARAWAIVSAAFMILFGAALAFIPTPVFTLPAIVCCFMPIVALVHARRARRSGEDIVVALYSALLVSWFLVLAGAIAIGSMRG